MTNRSDFEMVPSARKSADMPATKPSNQPAPAPDISAGKLEESLANNMGSIIELVRDIVDIQRMRVQSEAILAKMAEDRKKLEDEANTYVQMKNADTQAITMKIDAIRMLLKDFYLYNDPERTGITGEQFTSIIHTLLMDIDDIK